MEPFRSNGEIIFLDEDTLSSASTTELDTDFEKSMFLNESEELINE